MINTSFSRQEFPSDLRETEYFYIVDQIERVNSLQSDVEQGSLSLFSETNQLCLL